MGVREGGSYVATGKSGEPKLQERTKVPELHTVETTDPAPDVPSAPAPPIEPEPPAAPAKAQTKE